MVWHDTQGMRFGHGSAGIAATTPIATPQGWCAAGRLTPGAQVLTVDHGPQTLVSVRHHRPRIAAPDGPVAVPVWGLDNRHTVLLMPDQTVLLDTDLAADLYGDPLALVPALALVGWRGICRCAPPSGLITVGLGFAVPQIVYASRAVLLACPGSYASDMATPPDHVPYPLDQARHLVACLIAEQAGADLRARR